MSWRRGRSRSGQPVSCSDWLGSAEPANEVVKSRSGFSPGPLLRIHDLGLELMQGSRRPVLPFGANGQMVGLRINRDEYQEVRVVIGHFDLVANPDKEASRFKDAERPSLRLSCNLSNTGALLRQVIRVRGMSFASQSQHCLTG